MSTHEKYSQIVEHSRQYYKDMLHHLLRVLPTDVMVISVGEKAHQLLPGMMDGSELVLFSNQRLPHPSRTYTGRLDTKSRDDYLTVCCQLMSKLVGEQFLDVPYTIQDIPCIGRVCGVSGPMKIRERLQQDARAQKRLHLVSIQPGSNRKGGWTQDDDDSLMQSVEANSGGGWNAIAEKVTGRSANACMIRWLKKGHYIRSSNKHWSKNEEQALVRSVNRCVEMNGGNDWKVISENVPGRTIQSCMQHWSMMKLDVHIVSEEGSTVDDDKMQEEGLNENLDVDNQVQSDEIEIVQV
jgi:hypothetical protein